MWIAPARRKGSVVLGTHRGDGPCVGAAAPQFREAGDPAGLLPRSSTL